MQRGCAAIAGRFRRDKTSRQDPMNWPPTMVRAVKYSIDPQVSRPASVTSADASKQLSRGQSRNCCVPGRHPSAVRFGIAFVIAEGRKLPVSRLPAPKSLCVFHSCGNVFFVRCSGHGGGCRPYRNAGNRSFGTLNRDHLFPACLVG
jgi:hypothetical protein